LRAAREEARKARRKDAYFYLVLVATFLLASGASILVTVKLTERSERKLCAVVSSADDGYRTQPPPSTAGKLQAHNIAELRKTLGCPPPEGE
jgi:hypothetical protein